MNKSQAEKKVYAFHAVFRVDVNGVKPFQNPTEVFVAFLYSLSIYSCCFLWYKWYLFERYKRILQKRRHLVISLIHNLCQDFLKQ